MSNKQYPGWAYLIAGIIIGLFIAFIFYLREQKPTTPQTHNKPAPNIKNTDAPKPHFDFYKILPDLEVLVPDLEVVADKPHKKPPTEQLPKPTATLEQGEQFILQAGAFKEFREADKLKANLALLGIEASIQKVSVDNDTWHRVRIGPFRDAQKLNQVRRRLRENHINAITLKVST